MINSIMLGLLGGIGGTELLVIGAIILLMFGGKKIPEMMKGLGRGMKEFKEASAGETTTPTTEERKAS